jgi:hypothetical protein
VVIIRFRFWPAARVAVSKIVCALVLLAPAPLLAGGPDFKTEYDDAYNHYREAYFHARTGNTPVAAIALDDFIVKWSVLVGRFADNPPPDFVDDDTWKSTLQDILTRAEDGLDALDADDPKTARQAINPIRTIVGDLRRRNDVVTRSDTVDALSAAMEQLAGYRKAVRDMDDSEATTAVRELAVVVEALFEKCRAEAVPEIAADPEFMRLVDGAAESMAKLWQALETKDMYLFRVAIGELRSYERIMFLRFG